MSCYFQRNTILEFDKAGPFRILEVIGTGASSAVYRVVNTEDHTEHLLKEFHPSDLSLARDDFGNLFVMGGEREKRLFDLKQEQFVLGYKRQIEFRKDPILKNRTCNIYAIHSGYGTFFIDMTAFSGASYEKVTEDSFSDLVKRIKAITEVIAQYHAKGYLHLDIKPENIFVFPETSETVMLFDFDSVVSKSELQPNMIPRYTDKYAPPEQKETDAFLRIGEWTDIYAIGMIFFVKLFGRFPDAHEQESGSNYDFRLASGLLNGVDDKILEILSDFFRHTICHTKKFRWKSTDQMSRTLDQLLAAMQPSVKHVQDNADIRVVGNQISKLSKVILISAVLICLSVGFLAFHKSGDSPDRDVSIAGNDTVLEEMNAQSQTQSLLEETIPVGATETTQNVPQPEPITTPTSMVTEPGADAASPSVPEYSQPNATSSYIAETIAYNMNNFRSLIVTNSGVVYYLDGSMLHATHTDIILNLQKDFNVPLENGYLAYDPYQDVVYLLAGGSLSIHDISDFRNPTLLLENDSLILNLETNITPNIAVLPDSSILIPANMDGTHRLIIPTNTYSSFTQIYNLGSPYYASVMGDQILKFRESENEATVIPLNGSPEYDIALEQKAPYNNAVASSGNNLWFYWDGVGVCQYGIDGSVIIHIPQQEITITDYHSLDYTNIWAIVANSNGDIAFYDNSISCIRLIHSA